MIMPAQDDGQEESKDEERIFRGLAQVEVSAEEVQAEGASRSG